MTTMTAPTFTLPRHVRPEHAAALTAAYALPPVTARSVAESRAWEHALAERTWQPRPERTPLADAGPLEYAPRGILARLRALVGAR